MAVSKKKLDVYSLSDIFKEIELKLVVSMKRNLSKHEAWEEDLGFRWEQWQIAKLRSMESFRTNNRKILSEYNSEIQSTIDKVLKQSYGTAYNDSINLADEIYAELGIDSKVPLGSSEIPEESFFQINDDKLNAIIQEMQSDFKSTNAPIMRKMEDVYRQTIAKAVIEMGAGTTSIQKAVDDATKDFLDKGIDCITYKNGSRVNIASYAEMYLRTASQKANFVAQGKARDRMKVYTIMSSQHANCCERCLAWQAIVMIDDVYTSLTVAEAKQMSVDTGYPLLSDAMKDHFLHPNCRHSIFTWFPGKSSMQKPFTEKQSEEALKRYNLEQEQRQLENNLRKWKRVEAGSLSANGKETAADMVRYYQRELRDHIKANPNLRRDYWHERKEPAVNDEYYPFQTDLDQYQRYKEILRSQDLPETIEEFSAMKQKGTQQYELIKTKVKAIGYYNKAVLREPEYTDLIKTVAADTEMNPVGLEYSVKSADSYLRKVETNFLNGKTNYEVKDINRYTLSTGVDDLTEKTLNAFDSIKAKGYNISEVKNTWYDGASYKGINTTIRDANGNPFELQYHTPESFDLKNGPLHALYEKQRLLTKGTDEWIALEKEMIRMSGRIANPIGIKKVRKH